MKLKHTRGKEVLKARSYPLLLKQEKYDSAEADKFSMAKLTEANVARKNNVEKETECQVANERKKTLALLSL